MQNSTFLEGSVSNARLTPAQKKKLLKEQLLNKIKGKSDTTKDKQMGNQLQERANIKRENNQNETSNEASNSSPKENEISSSEKQEVSTFVVPPITTSWVIPSKIKRKNPLSFVALRQEMNVTVTGDCIPPIIPRFTEMHLPSFVLKELESHRIVKPTSIQMQCLPAVFMGRDVIGIASHNKGKSLVVTLSTLLFAYEDEMKLPLTYDEGPICLVLSSSKDNAIDLYNHLRRWNQVLSGHSDVHLRILLCIGGESYKDQVVKFREGCHIVVATPGRLVDHLQNRNVTFNICKLVCLDDGEKLLYAGMDEEVKTILNAFQHPKQTVLFSTSFPKPFIGFAREFMVDPIIVNAGEREVKRMDVQHSIQSVADTKRSVCIVNSCLNMTSPPVLIFTHIAKNVNEIEEYLLLKGLDVASITPHMSYEEGKKVVRDFKDKKVDILVTTDDLKNEYAFPEVNHVINYDIPSDFSLFLKRLNYVKLNGSVSTFVTDNTPEIAMKELKYFLLKTKQKIPEVMKALKSDKNFVLEKGNTCIWCGRYGHGIVNCPKV